jgi:ArsR family transcriptional regulator
MNINYKIFEIHANFCRAIANPKRLMIIALLEDREMSVNEIVEQLHVNLTNVSQHLRILRDHNIVSNRKAGQNVYYSLKDKRLPRACKQIRAILLDGLEKKGQINRLDKIQKDGNSIL